DSAVDDDVDALAGDGEVDHAAGDARNGDADDVALVIDHGAAGVAVVHAAVDLDALQYAALFPQRRDGAVPHGDFGVLGFVLSQTRTERETENEQLVQFAELTGVLDEQWLGKRPLVTQQNDGKVAVAINGGDGALRASFVFLTAVDDDVDLARAGTL